MPVAARLDPATRSGAFRCVGEQLGIDPETLRTWVRQAEIDEGHRSGTMTGDAQRLAEMEKEVRELRRAPTTLSRPARPRSGRFGTRSCWSRFAVSRRRTSGSTARRSSTLSCAEKASWSRAAPGND
ncbi:transposase [Kocuria sp. SL71]|uniref:transposase n=1 Tax=Kocuria sp. SL71 TaxID=2995151 RepID=UPI003FA3BAB2